MVTKFSTPILHISYVPVLQSAVVTPVTGLWVSTVSERRWGEEQQLAVTSSQHRTQHGHMTTTTTATATTGMERVTRMSHLISVFIVFFIYGEFNKELSRLRMNQNQVFARLWGFCQMPRLRCEPVTFHTHCHNVGTLISFQAGKRGRDNGKMSERKGLKFKGEWKNDRGEMQEEGEGENVGI